MQASTKLTFSGVRRPTRFAIFMKYFVAVFAILFSISGNAQAPDVQGVLRAINKLALCAQHGQDEPFVGHGSFQEGDPRTAEHSTVTVNVADSCDPSGNAHFDEIWVACDVDYAVEDNDAFGDALPSLYVRGFTDTESKVVACEGWGCITTCGGLGCDPAQKRTLIRGFASDGAIINFPSNKLKCTNGRTRLEILLNAANIGATRSISLVKDSF